MLHQSEQLCNPHLSLCNKKTRLVYCSTCTSKITVNIKSSITTFDCSSTKLTLYYGSNPCLQLHKADSWDTTDKFCTRTSSDWINIFLSLTASAGKMARPSWSWIWTLCSFSRDQTYSPPSLPSVRTACIRWSLSTRIPVVSSFTKLFLSLNLKTEKGETMSPFILPLYYTGSISSCRCLYSNASTPLAHLRVYLQYCKGTLPGLQLIRFEKKYFYT